MDKTLLQQEIDGDIRAEDLKPSELRALQWQRFGYALGIMLRGALKSFLWAITFLIGIIALIVIGRTPPTTGIGTGGGGH